MSKEKLTKRSVEQLAVKDRDYIAFDTDLPGFGVRVMPSGKRFFLIQYSRHGRTRRAMLGQFGPVTAECARKEATRLLGNVRGAGADPAAARDLERQSLTVKEPGERFLKQHVAVRCKPRTQGEYKRAVELFINPFFGAWSARSVTTADVADLHGAYAHIPYQANRTLGVLSKMMKLAETWGVRDKHTNPCEDIERYPEHKRERYPTLEELARLGKVLRDSNSEREAAGCIRLLLLTGCRLSEIQKLKWSYVDFHAGVLRLPDSKTGAKLVAIGQAMIDVPKTIPRIAGNPYVITGKVEGQHLTDMQKPWRRLRKRARLDDVRIHDLRHSFASDALELGEDLPMIGKLLGYTQVQTTARYAHLKTTPIRAAVDKVSNAIAAALACPPEEEHSEAA